LAAADRNAVLGTLLTAMNRHAAEAGVRVLVLKDLTDQDCQWAHTALADAGFSAIPSLPVAALDLPYDNFDGYLASLPSKLRSELRRKMRQASNVRIEFRDSLDGIEDEVCRLYAETRSHRKVSYDAFDEIPEGYFREVMGMLGGKARLLLMWVGETLAGFNLFIVERDRAVGKYVGLRYDHVREHNLYFVNWLTMVRYCIDHQLRELQVGQTSYGLKTKLGCKLHKSWIYCRHTGPVRGPLFRLLAPYAAFDKMDPDLQQLGDAAPYATPERALA
jgi:predicted N-acyltransferase